MHIFFNLWSIRIWSSLDESGRLLLSPLSFYYYLCLVKERHRQRGLSASVNAMPCKFCFQSELTFHSFCIRSVLFEFVRYGEVLGADMLYVGEEIGRTLISAKLE